MDPSSIQYCRWLAVISCAVLYNFVVIVIRSVAIQFQQDYWQIWFTLDVISDVIYIIDVVVQLTTGYFELGQLVVDNKRTAVHYTKTLTFKLDILSLLPTDLLYLIPPTSQHRPYVRFNRLARLPRMREFVGRLEGGAKHPALANLVRVIDVIIIVTVMIHWNACLYVLMSENIGYNSDRWVYSIQHKYGYVIGTGGTSSTSTPSSSSSSSFSPTSAPFGGGTLGELYTYAFYWATMTLSACADPRPPVTNPEIIFVIINFLVGVLLFAVVVGSFADIIGNVSRSRDSFQRRVDGVKRYARLRRVDAEWDRRIFAYFDYMWSSKAGAGKMVTLGSDDERDALAVLPHSLRSEIAVGVHSALLRRIVLLHSCETGLLERLSARLRLAVYCPGEFVCHKGDVGREMYIVKRGRLDVLADTAASGTVYATLRDGAYFGELSLLDIPGSQLGNRRVASVVSKGFSELLALSKDDLWEVLQEFPEAKSKMTEAARDRLKEIGQGVNDSNPHTSQAASEQLTTNQRIDNLESNVEELSTSVVRLMERYKSTKERLKRDVWRLAKRKKELHTNY